jgi:hypothetical protein
LYVKPVAKVDVTTLDNILHYNSTTGEIAYGFADESDNGDNRITAYNTVTSANQTFTTLAWNVDPRTINPASIGTEVHAYNYLHATQMKLKKGMVVSGFVFAHASSTATVQMGLYDKAKNLLAYTSQLILKGGAGTSGSYKTAFLPLTTSKTITLTDIYTVVFYTRLGSCTTYDYKISTPLQTIFQAENKAFDQVFSYYSVGSFPYASLPNPLYTDSSYGWVGSVDATMIIAAVRHYNEVITFVG